MLKQCLTSGTVALLVSQWTISGWAQPAPQSPSSVTTSEFRYRKPSSALVYDLLRLPEFVLKLALTPTFPVIAWADDVALDRRVVDLLTNDADTSLFLPTASFFGNDAPGFGFRYTHSDLWGGEQTLFLSGRLGTNADRSLKATVELPLVSLNGQPIRLEVANELNHNERYYGIGEGGSQALALQFSETRVQGGLMSFGTEHSLTPFRIKTQIGYLHREESPGTDPALSPVPENEPLAGFGAPHDFLELTQTFTHDLRDAGGRTHKGTLLQLAFSATRAIDGSALSAAGTTARGALFVRLAPRHRVLVFQLGTSAVTPWDDSDRVPNNALVVLGSESYPRGYAKRRFRDRVGWWGGIEYRYPIADLDLAGAGASATLFVDAGQVAERYRNLPSNRIRYSYGLGLRAETLVALAIRLQLGFSPEGAQFTLSLNEAYDRP